MPYLDAGKYDTHSYEWRDICLARFICEQPSLELRQGWINRIVAARRGRARAELEARVGREWARRAEWSPRFAGLAAAGTLASPGDGRSRAGPIDNSGDAAATPAPTMHRVGQLTLV